MHEPAVTLTNYALALLCGILAWRARSSMRPVLRGWTVALFYASALASFFGGTVHGFLPDPTSLGWKIAWPATLLAIGTAGFAAWVLGTHVGRGSSPAVRQWVTGVAAMGFGLYAGLVLRGFVVFWGVIVYYLPAVFFLMFRFALAWRAERTPSRRDALVSFGLTYVAAAIQQLQISVHPVWFDYNALYHVVQAAAFILLYRGLRGEAGRG